MRPADARGMAGIPIRLRSPWRLRFLVRLAGAPAFLIGLVQGKGGASWRHAVVLDLLFMQMVLPDKLGALPDPREDLQPWANLWSQFGGPWRGLLKLFLAAGRKDPARCSALAMAAGCEPPPGAAPDGAEEAGKRCDECSRVCASAGGLAAHRARVHGHRAVEREVVLTSTCPACGTDFRTRRRARIHVRYGAAACRAALPAGVLLPGSADAVTAADAAQAAVAQADRRVSWSAGAGLPAIRPAAAVPPPAAQAAALG